MIPPHSSVCGRQARQRLSLRDKTLEESFDIKFGEEMQSLNYVLFSEGENDNSFFTIGSDYHYHD